MSAKALACQPVGGGAEWQLHQQDLESGFESRLCPSQAAWTLKKPSPLSESYLFCYINGDNLCWFARLQRELMGHKPHPGSPTCNPCLLCSPPYPTLPYPMPFNLLSGLWPASPQGAFPILLTSSPLRNENQGIRISLLNSEEVLHHTRTQSMHPLHPFHPFSVSTALLGSPPRSLLPGTRGLFLPWGHCTGISFHLGHPFSKLSAKPAPALCSGVQVQCQPAPELSLILSSAAGAPHAKPLSSLPLALLPLSKLMSAHSFTFIISHPPAHEPHKDEECVHCSLLCPQSLNGVGAQRAGKGLNR